jgi:hypothetical protein
MKSNLHQSRRWLLNLLALTALGMAVPVSASADSVVERPEDRSDGMSEGAPADTLRQLLRLPEPATFAMSGRGSLTSPAMTIGIVSGYGASYGDAFAGIGYQARTRFADRADGGLVVGFGLGDPVRLLGLEVAVTSYGTARSCCRGGVSTKLHRILMPDLSVAVGVENALTWGNMRGEQHATDAGRSIYGVGTKILRMRADPSTFLGSAALTLGAGNGRYRTESDILADRERVNAFGSAGVRIARPASAVATWTGQDLVAGVSLVPFAQIPLYITPAVADLTTTPRFVLGVGYGFNYASLF